MREKTPTTASVPAQAQPPAETETTPVAPETSYPMTASEQTAQPPEEAQVAGAARVQATLDQTIGPRVSSEGDAFTATVGEAAPFPAGSKLVGHIVKMEGASAGSVAYVAIAFDRVTRPDGQTEPIDARLVGVAKMEQQTFGSREVKAGSAPGSEVIGSIIDPANLPETVERNELERQRGAVVSLGTGAQLPQLGAGTPLVVSLDGQMTSDRQPVSGHDAIGDLDDLTRIEAASASDVIGRRVSLASVPVESVVEDGVFWVGTSGDRILVETDRGISTASIQPGSRVQVTGVATRAPTADADLELTGTLRPDAMAELARRGVFIQASSVQPSSTPSRR